MCFLFFVVDVAFGVAILVKFVARSIWQILSKNFVESGVQNIRFRSHHSFAAVVDSTKNHSAKKFKFGEQNVEAGQMFRRLVTTESQVEVCHFPRMDGVTILQQSGQIQNDVFEIVIYDVRHRVDLRQVGQLL